MECLSYKISLSCLLKLMEKLWFGKIYVVIQRKTKIHERIPNTMQRVLSKLQDKNFKLGSKNTLYSGVLLKNKLEWQYIFS